ncbi:MAG TPA: efflux transporter outer membrane subunit [Caulobacteraceae bacterium]|jgi:NodT family efflux transporter outer membrane factor (OMF) lipoprotein
MGARSKLPAWAGGAVCALMAGCTVGPDFHLPAPPTAHGYTLEPPGNTASALAAGGQAQRFSTDLDVPGRWWELFGSPQIDQLVERALTANPDLQSAQAALRVARENLYAQRGALYPQAEANFNASRQKNPAVLASPLSSNAQYFGLNTGQVSVSYAPDLFGGVQRQIESTSAQADNQRFQLEATYLTLTANVVLAALQDASLRGQVRATEQAIGVDEEILTRLKDQRRLGEAAEGDVSAQENALAQARLLLPPLRKQLDQQRDLLAQLTGGAPAETSDDGIELGGVRLPTKLPLSLPSKLVQQRPDIRAAQANLQAASALIGVAQANRLPTITLTGVLGGSSTNLGSLLTQQNSLWSLTGAVTQPIFQGGALRHKQRAAEAAYDQAAADYRSTVLGAFQNVADTLHALDQDAQALKAAAEAQAAADKSLGLARQEFQLGEVNVIAVLNASQANQTAVAALAQAQGARYADTVALFQALGGGWWNRSDVALAAKN